MGVTDDDLGTRAAHGFPANPESVLGLIRDGRDVGSAEWGFPMTIEEVREVERRSAYVQATFDSGLIGAARARTDFAGVFLDHDSGGRVVVVTTSDPIHAEAGLQPLVPEGGVVTFAKARFTFAQLEDAKNRLMAEPHGLRFSLGYPITRASVDEEENLLVVAIPEDEVTAISDVERELERALAVKVRVVKEGPSPEVVCATRENCHTPMKAGIMIRQGSTGGPPCTMGFHIVIDASSDEQFITAGHCGHVGSNTWYHAGYGNVGTEQATIYVQNGVDIMRVQMSDYQDSSLIYAEGRTVSSVRDPLLNETVCASLGVRNAIDCGTVTDTSTTWIGEACQCTINGADTGGITIQNGDSGSPIYARPNSSNAVAIGVVNRTMGEFAKIPGALFIWGASIRD